MTFVIFKRLLEPYKMIIVGRLGGIDGCLLV